ncbi:MAG TPA: site-2 protease family protein [Candidatus Angelobacter sp.]
MPDNPLPPLEYQIFDPERQEIRVVVVQPPRRRYWLHAILFLATVFTTLCIGARLQYNFDNNRPSFSRDESTDYWPWSWALEDWHRLERGIPFSACLLGILTAHEFGHYILCLRRRVFATLPFFIPAPTLIGTMGAFIRIKSPIRSRSDLFDIGIAGPIAGFVVAVPVLIFGLLASKPLTAASAEVDIAFGLPLIFKLAHWILATFGNPNAAQVSLQNLYLHPAAFAAWFGMFATALNLLPGGQLDGGHIIFALRPRLHRTTTLLAILVLLPLSWFFWSGWLVWALVLRLTGSRHPEVPLYPGVDRKRWLLAFLALVMLVLTVTPAPLAGSLHDYLKERWQQHYPSK